MFDRRKIKNKGFDNQFFKKEQALFVVEKIQSGMGEREVGKLLGMTHQRISQIYKSATGHSIREYRYAVHLEEAKKKGVPVDELMQERKCKGCDVVFKTRRSKKVFHTRECAKKYWNKYQVKKPSYGKQLQEEKIKRAMKLLNEQGYQVTTPGGKN